MVRDEDGVRLRADLADPFQRETLAEAAQVQRQRRRRQFDLHGVAAKFIRDSIDGPTYAGLGTRNGGEVVSVP